MKILIATLLSVFAFVASSVQAKECKNNPINFRINPFSLVADSVSGGIDIGITDQLSLGLDGAYTYNTELLTAYKGKAHSGGISLTYYADSMHEDSFITSVGVEKSYAKLLDEDQSYSAQAISGDVKAGYRWLYKNGFNTKLAAGLSQTRITGSDQTKTKGLMPVAELSFGYQL